VTHGTGARAKLHLGQKQGQVGDWVLDFIQDKQLSYCILDKKSKTTLKTNDNTKKVAKLKN